MSPKLMLHIVAWAACLAAVTAFTTPMATTGSRLAGSLQGAVVPKTCDKCEDLGNSHAFDGIGANFDCQACNACHSNFQSGWCQDFHCRCGGIEHDAALLLHATPPLASGRLAEVASLSDWRVVATFLADHVDRVQYNADRGVLQMISCDGRVEAQYPVSEAVASALQ